jgi:cobaltochelatase CobN
MRTGGDDLAQALALLGCRPVWDTHSHRVTGIEVLPLDVLARPRVDVTFRVSGFFRDAFPTQIELLDDAIRAVARLDEPAEMNPLAASARDEAAQLRNEGLDEAGAERRATARIFGSMPGAYGAGLQAMIDAGGWEDEADLAAAYRSWGGFTYGRGLAGLADAEALERRLSSIQLVLHNQDNREHDLLDSDDYYQFEGGLAAAVRVASGRQPEIFHNDHARPESPRVRTLRHEIGRVVRGRAANPKWIAGVMRHGYKGAFEIAATVDYLFAFAATTRAVDDHHFDALFDAYLVDETVRDFIALHNPAALREIAACFGEAIRRELWRPRRNSAAELLTGLGA